jgi:hypothetical protein
VPLGLNKSGKLKDSTVSGTFETVITETSVTWATKKTVKVKKVKFTHEQATKAQRGSRGIALLFL